MTDLFKANRVLCAESTGLGVVYDSIIKIKIKNMVICSIFGFVSVFVATVTVCNAKLNDTAFQCSSKPNTPFTKLNDWHMNGVNLGGWMVLEPWITPSLFYQFLDADIKYGDETAKYVGMDSYTFCTALGEKEANRQVLVVCIP